MPKKITRAKKMRKAVKRPAEDVPSPAQPELEVVEVDPVVTNEEMDTLADIFPPEGPVPDHPTEAADAQSRLLPLLPYLSMNAIETLRGAVEEEWSTRLGPRKMLLEAVGTAVKVCGGTLADAKELLAVPQGCQAPRWLTVPYGEAGKGMSLVVMVALAVKAFLSQAPARERGSTPAVLPPCSEPPRVASIGRPEDLSRSVTRNKRSRPETEEDLLAQAFGEPRGRAASLAPVGDIRAIPLPELGRVGANDSMRRRAHLIATSALRYIGVDDNDRICFVGNWLVTLLRGAANSQVVSWFLRHTQQKADWTALFNGNTIPMGEAREGLRTAVFFMACMVAEGSRARLDFSMAPTIEAMCEKAAEEVCGREVVSAFEVNAFLGELTRYGHQMPPRARHSIDRRRPFVKRHFKRAPVTPCNICGERGHYGRDCTKKRN